MEQSQSMFIVLFLSFLSAFTISESRQADSRTTAFLVAIFLLLSLILTKQGLYFSSLLLLVGVLVSLVWAYWVQKGVVAFHKEDAYYLPYWMPVFMAQLLLILHLSMNFMLNIQSEADF